LPAGQTYREKLLQEVSIDPQRVHFLGRIPYARYLRLLQVSAAHVYLTVPFVLSWSMLEAMSAGCLVIGSDTAPVREGENGLRVDFFSPTAIADRVDEALEQPQRMRAIRQAARRTTMARYDVRHSIARYGRLIGALTAGTDTKVSARRAA
jgi:glycosyltransferase involved in cell wall biosynthesis